MVIRYQNRDLARRGKMMPLATGEVGKDVDIKRTAADGVLFTLEAEDEFGHDYRHTVELDRQDVEAIKDLINRGLL